jgi:hypothetical protein
MDQRRFSVQNDLSIKTKLLLVCLLITVNADAKAEISHEAF